MVVDVNAPAGSGEPSAPAPRPAPPPLPKGLLRRDDGVFCDPAAPRHELLEMVNAIFLCDAYVVGLDYAALTELLYPSGPARPGPARPGPARPGPATPDAAAAPLRLGADIARFDPARRALYKSVRVQDGAAEYYFELRPPERLDFDEFVAALWTRHVRFGIDEQAVRAVIASGAVERMVVARRREPTPGQSARIVEVSQDLRRNNAPLQLANGRFDLLSFQNRYPHVKKDVRLLHKLPCVAGWTGHEISGQPRPPTAPVDVDLGALAGPGTVIEYRDDEAFLVSVLEGFVQIERRTNLISIALKITGNEGVSTRTTGNLRLTGEYEELGEVQEQRLLDGRDITVHGDVYGNIHSTGGDVVLHRNLIGGSVLNADGPVRVKGLASGATVQTKNGEVRLERAENCVISGTRVVIGHAFNCEIIADEVQVTLAEGCAIAGRDIGIERAGPRKHIDMLLWAMVPDHAALRGGDAALELHARQLERELARRQRDIEHLGADPGVRTYLTLVGKLRRQELTLAPAQVPQFKKMEAAIAPVIAQIGKLRREADELRAEHAARVEQAGQGMRDKLAAIGQSRCVVRALDGDIIGRALAFEIGGDPFHAKPAKAIQSLLRGATSGAKVVFSGGGGGAIDWVFEAPPVR